MPVRKHFRLGQNCCLYQLLYLSPVLYPSAEQPDPPADLELTDPGARSVQLTWIPGAEHNSPIKSMRSSFSFTFFF